MSPSKTRTKFVPARPRSEVLAAVAVSASIIVGTALLIWLLRPGQPGVPGGGGLLSRQPRVTILVVVTAVALATVVVRVLRGRRRSARLGERGAILVGSGVVIAAAVALSVFWPGGVVRHWPRQPKLAPTPTTNSIPASSAPASASTTAASSTSAAGSTSPTTKG
jgi:peptidoglycan biosynthesis protein MviN/MurJ (putative lipid II flippase)